MLKVQYNLTEIKSTKYYAQMLNLEEILFSQTLEKIYKFDNTLKFSLVINKCDEVIGFLVYKDHGLAYDIFKIGVRDDMQKSGIASSLLEELFDKDIVLEVRVTNESAIRFYEKNKFYEYQKMPGYYNGVDGIKMIRRKHEY